MALVLADRVKETTTSLGTGTITLAGAVTGFQSFAVVGNGNTTYYSIAGQGTSEWEVGIGTYASSGTTLARTTVLASSNAGNLVVFSAGAKDVIVTYPSQRAVASDYTQTLTNKRITPRVTTSTTTVTPNADTDDQYNANELGATATIVNPTGTPTNGQRLTLRLVSVNSPTTITWGNAYVGMGIALPTSLAVSTYIGCIYNSTTSMWDVTAVTGPL